MPHLVKEYEKTIKVVTRQWGPKSRPSKPNPKITAYDYLVTEMVCI